MPAIRRSLRPGTIVASCLLLAACASGPSSTISLIPDQTEDVSRKEGVFTQAVKWKKTKPGCMGECPTLEVDSQVFPGIPKLTELVDHALAMMTGVEGSAPPEFLNIAEFESYYWETAASKDTTLLAAKTRYRSKDLTVIELSSWQYFTGAAHGISATQFLNWRNSTGRVLGMDDVLRPGKRPQYVAALRGAHQAWLATNPDFQADPDGYQRLWPFQENDNFAFTDHGVVIKYDSYAIAPYSHGQPELTIPYSALRDVLRPEFLPS
ncbi:MAG: RsiV family protein [Candidimonas sp.]